MVQRSPKRLGEINKIWFFSVFLILLLISFWDLIISAGTNLVSWSDTPYLIWVMFQNIGHIKSGNLSGFFETNAFYPNKLSLFFSDLLLPQSPLALPLTFLTDNPILVFNLVLLMTLILNYLSLFNFWRFFFKKDLLAFCGAIFFIFGPFLVLQKTHPQMWFYWPFFLGLIFWFKNKKILTGLMLVVQFLASVYLAVFLFVVLLISTLIKRKQLKKLLVVSLIFLLMDGVFIAGYIGMKKMYGFTRNRAEYEMYAAWPADYVFTSEGNSLLNQMGVVKKWNSFDLHKNGEKGMFAGVVLSALAVVGILKIKTKWRLFFLVVFMAGFANSLGTRIYGVPTPYVLIGRYMPLADSIRAMARWNFLFYMALVFFAIEGFRKAKNRWLVVFLLGLFLAESMPLFKTEARDYKSGYEKIRQVCDIEKRVLLEIPITHFEYAGGAIAGIDYLSKMHLSSLFHGCYLYNGYGSYQPKNLFDLEDRTEECLDLDDKKCFSDLMKAEGLNLVKFNDEKWLKLFDKSVVEF